MLKLRKLGRIVIGGCALACAIQLSVVWALGACGEASINSLEFGNSDGRPCENDDDCLEETIAYKDAGRSIPLNIDCAVGPDMYKCVACGSYTGVVYYTDIGRPCDGTGTCDGNGPLWFKDWNRYEQNTTTYCTRNCTT